MLIAVLSGFVLAIISPFVYRAARDNAGWVLGILPAGLFVYFATFLDDVGSFESEEAFTAFDLGAVGDGETGSFGWADYNGAVEEIRGEVLTHVYEWVPTLGVDLTMTLDGLSLMFALLITFIGTLIVVYGSGYLKGDRDTPRFYVFLLGFMASMLGLVLSDNLMTIFVFWELTSITSFMLIGYYHDNDKYRKCAHQSMMVTIAGGLAMFAGFVMLATMVGTYSVTEILAVGYNNPELITGHDWYVPTLVLILAGCFTKSAQFPFHFWLPNAMAGPTPVSAYLHSATMVKAGIYLLARLHPAMGGTTIWMTVLPVVGGFTMLMGIYLALRSKGYKQVLAYSTIMALGLLTMLVGIGTDYAMQGFVVFLLAHAMYKATLFMVAGIVDHEAGTKDLTVLRGLKNKMPVTFVCALVTALSLGGIAPTFGFIGKELMLEAVLHADYVRGLLVAFGMATGILGVAVALILGVRPFWGELGDTPKEPHEAPVTMLLGPVVLASLTLLTFLLLGRVDEGLVQAVVPVVAGEHVEFHLGRWHGVNTPLIMSLISIAVGIAIYWKWDAIRGLMNRLDWLYQRGPEAAYNVLMYRTLPWVANRQTRVLQNGYLRYYLTTIFLTLVGLVGYTFLTYFDQSLGFHLDVEFYHVVIVAVMLAAAIFASTTESRLGAVASAGVVGFAVALIYILFSAPDLGITQMLVETLTVILLVLVLYRLPGFVKFSSKFDRIRDLIVALLVGTTITVVLLAVSQHPIVTDVTEIISWQHILASEPLAHGRNVVNVVLVDFRTLDTLGEIFVLALAAMGVYAMVKFRVTDDEEDES